MTPLLLPFLILIPNPPLSYADIGHQGGVLDYGDFTMTVPEGCFNGYFRVNLQQYPAQSMFDGDEASVFFGLSGIPIEFLEPVEISIESNETVNLFAVIGEKTKATSQGTAKMGFHFLDVTKNGNKYTFTIDITDIPDFDTDDTTQIILGLVKNFVKVESKGNFAVYAPAIYANEAINLNQYLEEAYGKYVGSLLNFSYEKRTRWPVEVTVCKLDAGTFGYFVPSKWGNNSGYLQFNQDNLTDATELRLTAGHEFFHLVQALYDPRYGFIKAIAPSNYYWVEEASAVWAEGLFSANPEEYCSIIRNGHQMAPFVGMLKGAEGDAGQHGYGMSALIKYITKQYGEEKLVKIFQHELSGSTNIIQAFNNALPEPLSIIYPDFIDQYAQGNIYSDMGPSNLLSETAGVFSVNGANDTLKVFESSYPGLSAKVYKIDINYGGFNDQNSMLIKSYQGTKKLIYKLKGNEMTLLGTAFGDYVISDLPAIQQENALILVIVVHQYYTDLTEKLEIKINTIPPLHINCGKFTLKYVPVVEEIYYINSGVTITQELYYSYNWDNYDYVSGTYVNGNYYASWSTDPGRGFRHIGTMHLVIDELNRKIITGSITARVEAVDNPDNNYYWIELEFKDIPSNGWGQSAAWFGLYEDDFCNPNLVTHFDEASASSSSANRRILLSYDCAPSIRFEIKLNFQP